MEIVSAYDGTDTMQALILGKEITGISAFDQMTNFTTRGRRPEFEA